MIARPRPIADTTAIDNEHLTALLREAHHVLPDSPLRDRVASALDQELACTSCGHYLWNHNADGPCAVGEDLGERCPCTSGVGAGRSLRLVRQVGEHARQLLEHPNLVLVLYAALMAIVVLVRG